MVLFGIHKVRKKTKIRNRDNQVAHRPTQDTVCESDKTQENIIYKRVIPTGGHKAARNRPDSMTKTNSNTKKSTKEARIDKHITHRQQNRK